MTLSGARGSTCLGYGQALREDAIVGLTEGRLLVAHATVAVGI